MSIPAALRGLETREIGLDDLTVTLEAEDQRDVDTDSRADGRRDCVEALDGRRNLDQSVRTIHLGPELLGLGDGSRGVMGESGLDLDRHAPVDAVGGVEDGAEDVAGGRDVVGRDLEDGFVDALARCREFADLLRRTLRPWRERSRRSSGWS